MSNDPRILVVSGSFDGTTAFASDWQPAADPAAPRIATTQTTVGRFSFRSLVRSGVQVAILLARSWDSSVGLTMTQRTASTAEIADLKVPDDPVPFISDGAVRSVALSAAWSAPVILGPTDALTFSGARNTFELMVFEVGAGESVATLLQAALAVTSPDCCTLTETEVTGTSAIDATPGHLVVSLNAAADAVLTLPALADSVVGRDSVTIVRTAGAGEGRLITDDAADEVNGQAGVQATEYHLRFIGSSVTYWRVTGGWLRSPFGDQAYDELISGTNPIVVPPFRQGAVHVIDAGGAADNLGELPELALVDEGAVVVVVNTDSKRHAWQAATGDKINNLLAELYYIQPGEAAIFEASPTSWIAVGGGNQGRVATGGIAIVLTAAQVSGGVTTITMTGAVGQTLTLPPQDSVANGSMIAVNNATGVAHSYVPNGTDKINGVNAPSPGSAGFKGLFIALGPTLGWMLIVGA